MQPFQPTAAPVPAPLAGWMSNPPTVTHPAVSGGPIGLGGPSISGTTLHRCVLNLLFFCFKGLYAVSYLVNS